MSEVTQPGSGGDLPSCWLWGYALVRSLGDMASQLGPAPFPLSRLAPSPELQEEPWPQATIHIQDSHTKARGAGPVCPQERLQAKELGGWSLHVGRYEPHISPSAKAAGVSRQQVRANGSKGQRRPRAGHLASLGDQALHTLSQHV